MIRLLANLANGLPDARRKNPARNPSTVAQHRTTLARNTVEMDSLAKHHRPWRTRPLPTLLRVHLQPP
jgi:hypothetical protein